MNCDRCGNVADDRNDTGDYYGGKYVCGNCVAGNTPEELADDGYILLVDKNEILKPFKMVGLSADWCVEAYQVQPNTVLIFDDEENLSLIHI